ncbi:MAG: sensor histidine kinase, partial [Bacteroidota bacterium]|nr:sensor histidine kinase [Bacteroidota bacterium]
HVNLLDNGPGITKEEIELIFDKFYQANNQTRVKPTGTGLGLAICKNIIQMHGGWIQAENLEEGGSRFTFTIPLNITPESP